MSLPVESSKAKSLKLLLALAVSFLTFCLSPLSGQTLASTASVSGIISDPQGSRITAATVTFTSGERGITRTFRTSSSGAFSFSLLPPAVYSLKVVAAGFKTYQQGGIVLEVGQAAVLDAVLSVGSVAEQVVVSGETPLLSTDNANLGSEVSEKQMVDLPLNFRGATAFLFLDSSNRWLGQGVGGGGTDTADQDLSLMNFGGQFMGQTGFLLDGTWNGMMAYNGVIFVPSVDAVQEFKIQTNSFTAQYGLTDGNAVTVITKSGTDKFHGDVFEFFRNYALDANYYFNKDNGLSTPSPRPSTRMNQFGATAGGPLYIPGIYKQRERTFIFGAYEGLRLDSSSTLKATTPTSAMESGNLSSLLGAQLAGAAGTDALCRPVYAGQIYNPFSTRSVVSTCSTASTTAGQTVQIRDPIANNNLTSLMDPVAKAMASYFPASTNTNASNNFYGNVAVPTTSEEMDIRVDHNLSDKARLYGRYSRKWEAKVANAPLYGASDPAGPGQVNPNNRYSIVLGYNQVLSPTLNASVNAGLNRWTEDNVSQGYPFKSSTVGLPAVLDGISPFFPTVNIANYAGLGQASQTVTAFNEGTLSADLSKVHGPHILSFGFQGIVSQANGGGLVHTTFTFNQSFTSGPNPSNATSGTGDAFASFLLGAVASGSTGTTSLPALDKHYYGFYVQDDWKTTNKLTLNLGIRYDLQFAPTMRHNQQAYFEPNQKNPISALVTAGGPYNGQLVYNSSGNRGLYANSYTLISPRVGFSYLATKSILARGGFAIFYPSEFTGFAASPGFLQTTSLVSSLNGGLNPSSTLSNPFPQGILPVIGSSQRGLSQIGQSFTATVHERPSSYVEQWMLGLQYSPTHRDVFEASYVGNHGLHMVLSTINLNQLPLQDLALGSAALTALVPNPFFGQAAAAGSGCGLANATVPAFQLMLPMPQYCDSVTNSKANVGFSNYNALDLRYTHRLGGGLTVLATYTHGKMLDDVFGSTSVSLDYVPVVRNAYNLAGEKSVDGNDVPNSMVFSYIYDLPVGRGKRFGGNFSKPVDAVLGNWEIAGITSIKQGGPIAINGNLNAGSVYGGGQHVNVVGNPNVAGNLAGNPGCIGPTQIRTAAHWFNPCAFQQAAAGTFGNSPRFFSNLRNARVDDTDLSLSKWFNTGDKLRTQFRADMFNVLNHPNLGPVLNATYSASPTSSFGSLNYADISRQIQFALKIYW